MIAMMLNRVITTLLRQIWKNGAASSSGNLNGMRFMKYPIKNEKIYTRNNNRIFTFDCSHIIKRPIAQSQLGSRREIVFIFPPCPIGRSKGYKSYDNIISYTLHKINNLYRVYMYNCIWYII